MVYHIHDSIRHPTATEKTPVHHGRKLCPLSRDIQLPSLVTCEALPDDPDDDDDTIDIPASEKFDWDSQNDE